MKYILDDIEYDVFIEKKNNKNLYIRVKDDGIYVTCNYFTPKTSVKKILDENVEYLRKMLSRIKINEAKENKFFYLGKSYDIIFNEDINKVYIDGDKIYASSKKMLDKWVSDETIKVFDERYVLIFNHFDEVTKSPILKIRCMKSRWGVYNKKNHTITLNSKLIEHDILTIDYVIIHELSHIVYFDHSKCFWNLVSKYCPNYKKIRKEMRE